ncbi:peptide deformylase [Brachybacterium squillarum]|uniref:peptide deformylase n=1 Tax=Brachybacterium squillarum TaxID=661979 RepID=UPI002221F450|nr:peptide deformylase [Brachybacterium squillarum]MCW1804040.1 peptide deformylase [Brachybacterium squillarum]
MDISDLARRLLDRRDSADAPLRIVQTGHPALRRRAAGAVARLDAGLAELLPELADAMTLTMREAPGVGLAAPQIGLPLQMVVVEDRYAGDEDDDGLLERRPLALRALLDPAVELLGTEQVYAWEGCLSVDGFSSIVPRSRRVRLRATELLPTGELREVDEEHAGWTARILQHETDHLHGVLCHDGSVPRSFSDNAYVPRLAELPEAVRRLGLTGDIERLGDGEVVVDTARR